MKGILFSLYTELLQEKKWKGADKVIKGVQI